MSNPSYPGASRKGEPSPSRELKQFGYTHSFFVDSCEWHHTMGILYRPEVLFDRMLRFLTHACRADRAMLIMNVNASPCDEASRIYVHPEPVSEEETKLWEYVATYVRESVRLGIPLSLPESLRDALSLGTGLISPPLDLNGGTSIVSVFANSSSPPLDSEDEATFSRLIRTCPRRLRATASLEEPELVQKRVSRILRTRNILLSVSEMCSTIDSLVELAVDLGLAESACVRILDENAGLLKLVASAGDSEAPELSSHVPASGCSIIRIPSSTVIPRLIRPYQCHVLEQSGYSSAICASFSHRSGELGVMSLLNPPDRGLKPADMRIIRGVAQAVQRAFWETQLFDSGKKTWDKTPFLQYASIVSKVSDDVTYIARELLACLRKAVCFQVGAFVGCQNGYEVISVLFTSVDPLVAGLSESKRSNRAYDADGHTESNGTSTGIVLGDPQAQEWAEKALKHLEPDVKCIHIRPFYMHGSRWPSCLAVPLVSAGDTVGCFIIGRPEGYRFYSEDIDYCEDIRRDLALLWDHSMARIRLKIAPAAGAMLERIATLEQLAVGAAHEIKNPLSVIKGYMQVMQQEDALPPEVRQTIERLLWQVEQIGMLSDDLASLAKLSISEPVPSALPKLLDEILDALESQVAGTGISIVRDYPEYVPEILADAGKLQQAFSNICRNAIEVMSETGGELRVTLTVSDDRQYVEVEFKDTGPGICSEAMAMLFTPFFTTKKHGTGLGLNISRYIVELHGGTIRAENAKDRTGAIFTVVLPTTCS
ncbi:MAG: HAMP domain-containing sensor histidine kinase [Bacillota bacterium]